MKTQRVFKPPKATARSIQQIDRRRLGAERRAMKSTKTEAVPRQQSQPPNDGACTKSTESIVAGIPADVKAIRELRTKRSIPVADIVEVVAAGYPKFDRYLLSKVEHGDEYGIRLRDDAMATLMTKFAPEQRKHRSRDRHNKAKRVQARLSDDVYSRLQRTVAANNITIQSLLEQLILNYIIEHSKGDPHDQTAQ